MKTSRRIYDIPGVSNAAFLGDGTIIRCAQPEDSAGYASLKACGVDTIINLRHWHNYKDTVESLGMAYLPFPMTVFDDVDVETIDKILAVLYDDAAYLRVAIHCAQGQDRTGAICACARIVREGWPVRAAKEELIAHGHLALWVDMDESIRNYVEAKGVAWPSGCASPGRSPLSL